jgi:fluoride exporter
MVNLLVVAMGGGLGAVARYLLTGGVQWLNRGSSFPFGTLTVNIVGCFTIGLLGYLAETRGLFTTEARLLLFTGILGGFTTFSTFSYETLSMARLGYQAPALANVAAHFLLCLAAVWAGRAMAHSMWR